jgi:hypothetical protein
MHARSPGRSWQRMAEGHGGFHEFPHGNELFNRIGVRHGHILRDTVGQGRQSTDTKSDTGTTETSRTRTNDGRCTIDDRRTIDDHRCGGLGYR